MAAPITMLRSDGRLEMLTTTKETGSWSQYIEVCAVTIDDFGDQVFARKGYAQKYAGIESIRKYEGHGASKYCRWILRVDPAFPLVIRQVTNAGGGQRGKSYDILFAPKTLIALETTQEQRP